MKLGKLYGVGVGPGDPKLLTLRAVEVLKAVDHIFVAASTRNSYSAALNIVRAHIPEKTIVERLDFPMTKDPKLLEEAWRKNAQKVAYYLRQGQDTAFLTLGDPSLYSTFGYLYRRIRQLLPQIDCEFIPGISAFQAAAARLRLTLVEADQSLLLASGATGGQTIREMGKLANSLVLYKVYRKTEDILEALEEIGRLCEAVAITACGLPEEKIYEKAEELRGKHPPYFTLILVGGKR
ncbi:precorrin-2 C(20)-methyltransferase [Thermosulfuriphilus sp.]